MVTPLPRYYLVRGDLALRDLEPRVTLLAEEGALAGLVGDLDDGDDLDDTRSRRTVLAAARTLGELESTNNVDEVNLDVKHWLLLGHMKTRLVSVTQMGRGDGELITRVVLGSLGTGSGTKQEPLLDLRRRGRAATTRSGRAIGHGAVDFPLLLTNRLRDDLRDRAHQVLGIQLDQLSQILGAVDDRNPAARRIRKLHGVRLDDFGVGRLEQLLSVRYHHCSGISPTMMLMTSRLVGVGSVL
jgi:hypothetical protein